ncbi:MAG TPA: hypothetical protein VE779_08125 [Candidatus Angelobacter sp.]|jgi:hypothetical protein|nr:hypothetical protein [Candidatus Angelobacter sp.]
MTPQEQDFPPGHPARGDYNPRSPEAQEWAAAHYAPKGERDFPIGHLKAGDTPGNLNHIEHKAGVDPQHLDLEPHSGRTREQVAALADLNKLLAELASPSPVLKPVEAPPPPEPGDVSLPAGQPGE